MKAFTLIELMVVLAITGVMLALGTWGLVSLQRSILVKGAGDSLISVAKETQNKAKNDAFDVGQSNNLYLTDIFAFKITFTSTATTRSTCHKTPSALAWTCISSPAPENIKDSQYTEVDFLTSGTSNPTLPGCQSILFVDLTGDIRVNTASANDLTDANFTNASCGILVRHHSDFNANKTVTFDGINNGFSVTP